MTPHQLLVHLREAITSPAGDKPSWFNPEVGLCSNLETLSLESSYTWRGIEELVPNYKEVTSAWPLFSGSFYFPIPGAGNIGPEHAYFMGGSYTPKYDLDTQYGRNRLAFLDYLIDCTKEQGDSQ